MCCSFVLIVKVLSLILQLIKQVQEEANKMKLKMFKLYESRLLEFFPVAYQIWAYGL